LLGFAVFGPALNVTAKPIGMSGFGRILNPSPAFILTPLPGFPTTIAPAMSTVAPAETMSLDGSAILNPSVPDKPNFMHPGISAPKITRLAPKLMMKSGYKVPFLQPSEIVNPSEREIPQRPAFECDQAPPNLKKIAHLPPHLTPPASDVTPSACLSPCTFSPTSSAVCCMKLLEKTFLILSPIFLISVTSTQIGCFA